MISKILLKLAMLYWEGLLQFGNIISGGPNIIWRYNNGYFYYNLAVRYLEVILQFGDVIIEVFLEFGEIMLGILLQLAMLFH